MRDLGLILLILLNGWLRECSGGLLRILVLRIFQIWSMRSIERWFMEDKGYGCFIIFGNVGRGVVIDLVDIDQVQVMVDMVVEDVFIEDGKKEKMLIWLVWCWWWLWQCDFSWDE